MTPAVDIIPQARFLLQDEQAVRWTDAELLTWINDCLSVMLGIRPDLFNVLATHSCAAGAEQSLTVDRQVQFQEVVRVVGGTAVLPTSRQVLSSFNPSWFLGTEGPAVNWMPHDESPTKFYVSPPSPAGQQLQVRLVQDHATLVSVTDTINLPENYAPAIGAFVVSRAEAKEDEQVNNGRMAAFMSDFVGMIGGNK